MEISEIKKKIMEKIAKEQNQYYILGYTPTESAEGSCHTLRVKVDRGGTNVRARSGYFDEELVRTLANGDPRLLGQVT